jgi:hypothetical protein
MITLFLAALFVAPLFGGYRRPLDAGELVGESW